VPFPAANPVTSYSTQSPELSEPIDSRALSVGAGRLFQVNEVSDQSFVVVEREGAAPVPRETKRRRRALRTLPTTPWTAIRR
jgi:hypothetical protein